MSTRFDTALNDLTTMLVEVGFTRRRKGILTFALEDERDLLGWVGLLRATRYADGRAAVLVTIGIRSQVLEQELCDLTHRRCHPYDPPSVSTPLHALLPDESYRADWAIPDAAVEREIVDAVVQYGVPFLRTFHNLDDVIEAMTTHGYAHTNVPRRLVALHLLGRTQEVQTELQRLDDMIRGRDDPEANYLAEVVTQLKGA